jgi:histone acetyltransferase SAS3
VGYFSKEKRASSQNNVSCILTLPIHQRKGYGNLLIDFSYLLTKAEEKTGSPEKPLSDMGLVSYRNYWRLELCKYFLNYMESDTHKSDGLSIQQISHDTGMTPDDVVSALEGLRALVRDNQTHLYAFRADLDYCRNYVSKWESKGYVQLKPSALAWTPYVMGRSNVVNFELGPPINTIAPREEDEAKVQEGAVLAAAEAAAAAVANTQSAVNGAAKSDSQPESAVASQPESEQPSEPVKSIERVKSEDKENADPDDQVMEDAPIDAEPASWDTPYKDIPASRFEVFPPIPGARRDRNRNSITRPAAPRTGSSSSARPKSRPSGSARRPAASRPRNNSSRRKSGGTGRGPGRWPKGTKKSDYGNADSGPGLPPGWKEKQGQLEGLAEGSGPASTDTLDEKPAQDEVRVLVSSTEASVSKAVNGQSQGSEADSISRAGSGDEMADGDDDVDAEGEDE